MKCLIRTSKKKNSSSWQVFLLVSLLLFLPLSQADHLEQHHNLPNDIHCQLLHWASDFDDLKGTLHSVAAFDAAESLVVADCHSYQFNHCLCANIRAPPVNR